ncbi:RNA polymerase sigma factor [Amycolatopsis sp. WGS_07]|uniref:RNA polymerase sigma factor n=1 Tax=Amycolatopsis sp. WGS_07 TaxID=3076764 RepID=UPI0038730A51
MGVDLGVPDAYTHLRHYVFLPEVPGPAGAAGRRRVPLFDAGFSVDDYQPDVRERRRLAALRPRLNQDGVVNDVAELTERIWRTDAPSMLGALSRRLGDFDQAEEALSEAIAEALKRWPGEGVPSNPAGWLVTTGWHKAIDRLRRDAVGREKAARAASEPPPEPGADDRLGMIFACCHPDLPEPARVALTLYAAGGLTTAEIAAAFLVPLPTMAQRLSRAKRQLRERGIGFEPPQEYADRLPAVLAVLYLVFNEGYLSSGPSAQRQELAREGVELARQLAEMLPREPEVAGLAALLELHQARVAARFDAQDRIVLLEHQDRRLWDRSAIQRAVLRLRAAVQLGQPGPYQTRAGIAAIHAVAASFEDTDWVGIRALHDRLYALDPSPVVLLNRAVATRYAVGPAPALDEVDALEDRLSGYHRWHAARADLLAALDRPGEARVSAERALELATNPAERELMARRVAEFAG